jgi:hypothetical protein
MQFTLGATILEYSFVKHCQGIFGIKEISFFWRTIDPIGPLSLQETYESLGNVTWFHFLLRFFETLCEHVPWNKLCKSTNFIIYGPRNQNLWGYEHFRRSLGKAGTCWSQPARVDYMYKKMWVGGRRIFLQGGSYDRSREAGDYWSLDCCRLMVGS